MKETKTKTRFHVCKRQISDRQKNNTTPTGKGVSGTTIDMTIFI
ncbi:hypothetical protein [Spirosoma flavum]|uniref:Uncharacterized protein n=1 Tax=Spirosoma flavum TaxID=2048557 RepID=A0ABW6AUU9_9BACT